MCYHCNMGGGPDPLSDEDIHESLDALEAIGFITTEGEGETRTVTLTREGIRALSVLSPFIPPVLVQQMAAISMAVRQVLARHAAEEAGELTEEEAGPGQEPPQQLHETPPGGLN